VRAGRIHCDENSVTDLVADIAVCGVIACCGVLLSRCHGVAYEGVDGGEAVQVDFERKDPLSRCGGVGVGSRFASEGGGGGEGVEAEEGEKRGKAGDGVHGGIVSKF
jgi:hypothetical protein